MRGLFAIVAIAALVSSAAPAFGQGGTTSAISGVVVAGGGRVLTCAHVVVRHNPAVATPSGNGQGTINGLPRGTTNITLDGVNIQDNTLRSTDGFFAIVSPRLDAVEEVTVTTAAQGAADAGQGAVQVKFVTRMGTNA